MQWPERPDAATVVELSKEPTGEGLPSQIRCVVEYTKNGEPLGRRALVINPGLIGDLVEKGQMEVPEGYDPAEPKEDPKGAFPEWKFKQLYASIPGVAQSVKDAVRNQLPDSLLVNLWKG